MDGIPAFNGIRWDFELSRQIAEWRLLALDSILTFFDERQREILLHLTTPLSSWKVVIRTHARR